jgi:hypothetical protein
MNRLIARTRCYNFLRCCSLPHFAGLTDLMLDGTVNYISHVTEEFAPGKKPKSILNWPAKPRRLLEE